MGNDVDAEVEVGREASHDRELLVVLFSEHGDVRSSGAEQLGDHGGHAVEVARPRGALHRVGQPCDVDGRREPVGIHRSYGRDVHDTDTGGSADSQVVLERPRVPVEVALLAELQRIHEDRHDHLVDEPAGCIDQFEMAPMQGAHGGHEANGVAGDVDGIGPGAHTDRGVDHDGHSGNATARKPIGQRAAEQMDTRRRRWVHRRSTTPRARRERMRQRTCRRRLGGSS